MNGSAARASRSRAWTHKCGAIAQWITCRDQDGTGKSVGGSEVASDAATLVVAIGGHHHHRQVGEALFDRFQELQAVHARDPAPVFDAILEKAMVLCHASAGALHSYDGESFVALATRGVTPVIVDAMRKKLWPTAKSAIGRIVLGECLVHIPDVKADEAYREGDPLRLRTVEFGARTLLVVPLLKDETLIGAFTVYRTEVRRFSEREIGLIKNFAVQAVIVMENARPLGELRERTEEVASWNRELKARVAAQLAENSPS